MASSWADLLADGVLTAFGILVAALVVASLARGSPPSGDPD